MSSVKYEYSNFSVSRDVTSLSIWPQPEDPEYSCMSQSAQEGTLWQYLCFHQHSPRLFSAHKTLIRCDRKIKYVIKWWCMSENHEIEITCGTGGGGRKIRSIFLGNIVKILLFLWIYASSVCKWTCFHLQFLLKVYVMIVFDIGYVTCLLFFRPQNQYRIPSCYFYILVWFK